eukprot:2703356-Ditylum_brightwellii.AAC.1
MSRMNRNLAVMELASFNARASRCMIILSLFCPLGNSCCLGCMMEVLGGGREPEENMAGPVMAHVLGVMCVAALCTNFAHGRQTLPTQRSICHGCASHNYLFSSPWQGRHCIKQIVWNDGRIWMAMR